jgi:hypothetical protein
LNWSRVLSFELLFQGFDFRLCFCGTQFQHLFKLLALHVFSFEPKVLLGKIGELTQHAACNAFYNVWVAVGYCPRHEFVKDSGFDLVQFFVCQFFRQVQLSKEFFQFIIAHVLVVFLLGGAWFAWFLLFLNRRVFYFPWKIRSI